MAYTDKTLTISLSPNGASSTATLTTTTGVSSAGISKKKSHSKAAGGARPSASRTISVRSVRHGGKPPAFNDPARQEDTATWLMDTVSFWFADAMEVAFFGPYDEMR